MRRFSLLLIFPPLWSGNTFGAQSATAPEIPHTQEKAQAARFREGVQKRGTCEGSRVKARPANGTEVKGYISKIDEPSFAVTNNNYDHDCGSHSDANSGDSMTRRKPTTTVEGLPLL